MQYKSALIVDRINAYFGYGAVAGLRIVQTPGAGRPQPVTPAAPRARATPAADPVIAGIADDGLRVALERMQAAIQGRRR